MVLLTIQRLSPNSCEPGRPGRRAWHGAHNDHRGGTKSIVIGRSNQSVGGLPGRPRGASARVKRHQCQDRKSFKRKGHKERLGDPLKRSQPSKATRTPIPPASSHPPSAARWRPHPRHSSRSPVGASFAAQRAINPQNGSAPFFEQDDRRTGMFREPTYSTSSCTEGPRFSHLSTHGGSFESRPPIALLAPARLGLSGSKTPEGIRLLGVSPKSNAASGLASRSGMWPLPSSPRNICQCGRSCRSCL